MELLKERIRKDGVIKEGNVLKVDNFLNHQMDIELFNEIGKEFKRRFADVNVDRILTIEASGIGIAAIAAQYFNVPVVFAKNPSRSIWTARCCPRRSNPLRTSAGMRSSWPAAFSIRGTTC